MSNFARIIDNTAVDVSSDPAAQFHPDIAAQFVSVPDTVRCGWQLVDGAWTAPEVFDPPEPAVVNKKVSPVEFKLLFTSQERVAIKAARATDPIVDDFFEIVEDPRLTFVDLNLQSTQNALSYLVQQSLITVERRAEILTGQLQ
ncbi:MAG: hypothetical protein Q7W55_10475 [Pseudohongiella sp.]|nr:hypothetical protein [Pseudohongiella sp.]